MELWDCGTMRLSEYCYDFWIMVTTQGSLFIAKLSPLVKLSFRNMINGIMVLQDYGIMGLWDHEIMRLWDYGIMGLLNMGLLLLFLDYGYNTSCFVHSQAVSSSKVII